MREIRILFPVKRKLLAALKYILRFPSYCTLFIFLSFSNCFAQSVKVVFSENFDNTATLQPWAPYFSSGWFCEEPLNVLQAEPGRGKVLKVNFPANTVAGEAGMGNYRIPLDSAYKELYLSWEVFIPSFFDYGWSDTKGGGKFFGGFAGGSMIAIPNNDATDNDGWASMLMFQDGYFSTYNYFKGANDYTSDGWPNGSYIAPLSKGEWKRITIRLKINDDDQANGIFEVFNNDVLAYQKTNAKIVNAAHPEYFIEHIYLNTFFGGSGAVYSSPIDQYFEFDNLVAFYYPKGSSGYRSGASEKARTLQIPQATSYHPVPPNKFTPATYTEAKGTISSHCAFYQPVNDNNIETSTIQVAGATYVDLDVFKFEFDPGSGAGSAQILRLYQGTGAGKVLKMTFQKGVLTTPGSIRISGNSATLEWLAGKGAHGGFSLNYSSDGTGSGKNFTCGDFFARQYGIPTPVPPAPSSLLLKSFTNNSASFQWTDNSDNESWFEIERRGPNDNNLVQTIKSDANTITYTDIGLQANSSYSYRIRAYNTVSGYSSWSNTVDVKTIIPIPSAPSSLILKNLGINNATIQWTDNSNNENWFEIERRGPNDNNLIQTFKSDANTTTYADAGLVANSIYAYTIRAYNSTSGFSPWSNSIQIKTGEPLPGAPSSLNFSNLGNNTVTIKWTDNSTNETGFEIQRTGPNNTALIQTFKVAANLTTYSESALVSNSVYTYRIRAVNSSGGYSSFSDLLEIKTTNVTLPIAPSKLMGKHFTNESITVRWNDNSNDENGFVITRTLATDSRNSVTITVNANDTVYTDTGLEPSKSYVYVVKAINPAGSSAYSNKDVASTLSLAETKRVKENLIAYYNFNYDPANYVHDLSGYGDPLNLRIFQPASIDWNEKKKLEVLSNVDISSVTPARKIISALKKTNEITLECWVRPSDLNFAERSRIISLSSGDAEVGFTIDQDYIESDIDKSIGYCVRLQTASTNISGYPIIEQADKIEYLNLNHIVYVKDSVGKERLYVNNRKTAEGFRPSDFSSWSDNFYLRLSNEKDLLHGWKGTLYSVAIYNKALTDNQISRNFSAGPSDSVRNNGLELKLNAYPNPATDKATFEITPLENHDFAPRTIFRIVDLYGVTRYEEVIFNPNNPFSRTLDFRNYLRGIYFMQVISGKEIKTGKLIIR